MNLSLATPPTTALDQPAPTRATTTRLNLWTVLGLALIVALAAALRFGNLDAIGQSNTYYTAAIKSMLQSWQNFFFVAAEPGGSVSIDKPALGLWLETISAYFLGVSGFATVLPNLLAGMASVILVFHLVRRSFGNGAGLLAALALAVTPVAIAVERNNTPDGMLVFTILLAAWAFIKATETLKLRYLLLGAVFVGLGFNIKMMQALLPLPAFYALYFLGAKQGWWRKLQHLTLASVLLAVVALSWAVVVDLTPADLRPYVGSSANNSVLNLMLGYNGLQRLTGNAGAPGSGPQGAGTPPNFEANGTNLSQGAGPFGGSISGPNGAGLPNGAPPAGGPEGGMMGNAGGMFGTGQAGVFRIFQSGLAAQASWLLPLALLLLVAMALGQNWWQPYTAWHHGLLLWGGWLLTAVAFFSVAGFFHQYYLIMLGAPLAALVAMGIVWVVRWAQAQPKAAGLFLLIATLITLAYQVYAVSMYETLSWWIALPIGLGLAGLGLLARNLLRANPMHPRLSMALTVAALFIIPTIWAGLTTAYANVQGAMPQAYGGQTSNSFPNDGGRMGNAAPAQGNTGINQTLLDYVQANTQGVKYLMVVPSSMQGAGYVLATGRPVLYAGGFNGSDPVIDSADLAELVANGEVRYVLWGASGGPGGQADTGIESYLQTTCTIVNLNTSAAADGGPNGQSTLYQCTP